MNTSLVSQPKCHEEIRQELESLFSQNVKSVSNKVLLWKTREVFMRGVLIKLGAREKRIRAEKLNNFLEQIRKLEKSNKTSPNDSDTALLCKIRDKFHIFLHASFDHYIKRLQINWYAYGNRPRALLAKQVKRKAANSKIPYMHTAQGQRASNPTDIANCFRQG